MMTVDVAANDKQLPTNVGIWTARSSPMMCCQNTEVELREKTRQGAAQIACLYDPGHSTSQPYFGVSTQYRTIRTGDSAVTIKVDRPFEIGSLGWRTVRYEAACERRIPGDVLLDQLENRRPEALGCW